MNLFRSEEHAKNWSDFKEGTEAGINRLSDVVALFSVKFFTHRLMPDYVTMMGEYEIELTSILKTMGSFWQPPE